jgi:hypothetical protein
MYSNWYMSCVYIGWLLVVFKERSVLWQVTVSVIMTKNFIQTCVSECLPRNSLFESTNGQSV